MGMIFLSLKHEIIFSIIYLPSIISIISNAIQDKCLAFGDRIIKLNVPCRKPQSTVVGKNEWQSRTNVKREKENLMLWENVYYAKNEKPLNKALILFRVSS